MKRLISTLLLSLALIACGPAVTTPQQFVSAQTQQAANPNVKVWVNTNSGVYHCAGTRWYGATKQGEYMTQKQAQDKGNRPAYGKYCQ
jgi:hypothetical protein